MALGKLGKYERVDVLGHGATGIVYLAWDTLLKKQIALKEVDVQFADINRFLEEARVMDRLNHPNIVRVNSVDIIEGRVVIDMEYVKGQNLQHLLRRLGRLPLSVALDITIQVLDALIYAHQMRTIHRDIKPANILLSATGQVKLTDFGLAEVLASNSYAGGAGTYAYMAPEDFSEERQSDHRSDLWAVGVTFYEMLTGRRPFNVASARDPFAWRRVLTTEEPAPLTPLLLSLPGSSHSPDGTEAATAGGAAYDAEEDSWSCPITSTQAVSEVDEAKFRRAVQAVVTFALAKEKSVRYATAVEFRTDLIAIRDSFPTLVEFPQVSDAQEEASSHAHPAAEILAEDSNVTPPTTMEPPQPLRLEAAEEPVSVSMQTLAPETPVPESAAVAPKSPEPVGETLAPVNETLMPEPAARPAPLPAEPSSEHRTVTVRDGKAKPSRIHAEPERIDFGVVRADEERVRVLTLKNEGGARSIRGRVVHAPAWVQITPSFFSRPEPKLKVMFTAEGQELDGDQDGEVRVETDHGDVRLSVHAKVQPPRPRFSAVALWYVPLFAVTLLPPLIVAWGGQQEIARLMVPAASLASALLAVMLMMVTMSAGLGSAERMACGILASVMAIVLGVTFTIVRSHSSGSLDQIMIVTAAPFLVMLVMMAFTRRYWRLWAGAIGLIAVLAASVFGVVLIGI
jgi:serine/threonine-protein kinase